MFPGQNFVNPYMPKGAAFQANMAYSDLAFISGYTLFNPYNTFTPGFTYGVSPYFPGNVTNGMSSTSAPPAQAQVTCAANPEIIEDPSWYIDSGATNHITNDLGKLVNPKAYVGIEQLFVGNGNALLIEHGGSVKLATNTLISLTLNHVLYVPKITKNLISVSKLLVDNNVTIEFVGISCLIKARSTGIVSLEGVAKGGLYKVQSPTSNSQFVAVNSVYLGHNKLQSLFACLPYSACEMSSSKFSQENKESYMSVVNTKVVDVNLLHRRLGHPAIHVLKTVLNSCNKFVGVNKIQNLNFCDACQFGKNHMLHFNPVQSRSTKPLQLIFTDL